MEPNIFSEILGVILLPVLIVLTFGMLTGARTDGIISSMFSIFTELIRGCFKLLIPLLTTLLKELPKLVGACIRIAVPLIEGLVSRAKNKKSELKIIVEGEKDSERK